MADFLGSSKFQKEQSPKTKRVAYPLAFIRWLQLKKYQYEVTFSLYMLTSTEKFIFNFILIALVSLLTFAVSFYLPNHISIIYSRIWYYVVGEVRDYVSNSTRILNATAGALSLKSNAQAVVAETAAIHGSTIVQAAAETVLRVVDEL